MEYDGFQAAAAVHPSGHAGSAVGAHWCFGSQPCAQSRRGRVCTRGRRGLMAAPGPGGVARAANCEALGSLPVVLRCTTQSVVPTADR